ncbi:MAG: (d)CMP kinase [Proteobacteria bacterium]|nr:(d)CMP kinase [Pseudomonadota bacterium]MBU4469548.1 (d)CMP kinase [Pseudomonadota bacterium]MCG2753226.1 (d)CMP kinase [Desulfobacteraceae bacterium]
MEKKKIVITIDGPSGAGKTTASRMLARRLGYKYMDTGALYRGIALASKEKNIHPDDEGAMKSMLAGLTLNLVLKNNSLRLLLNERDVSDLIRTPEISMMASAVSALPLVREYLLEVQRTMGRDKGVVFEGRDMGTVVFPEAEVKFYLDASPENRAMRRYRELDSRGKISLEQVKTEMVKRDFDDSHRKLAPLKQAEGAVRIDSSNLNLEEVLDIMLSHIETALC